MTGASDFGEQDFVFGVPLWFVVAEEATAVGDDGKRRIDLPDDIPHAEAFCAGAQAVVVFTDADLAEQHAKKASLPNFPLIPFSVDDVQEAAEILEGFYPQHYTQVTIDPMVKHYPGRGRAAWTNRTVSIPDFIASLKKPLPPDKS